MSEAALAVTCARDHGRQLAMNAGDRLLAQLNQLERALDEAASSRHDYFDEEREGQEWDFAGLHSDVRVREKALAAAKTALQSRAARLLRACSTDSQHQAATVGAADEEVRAADDVVGATAKENDVDMCDTAVAKAAVDVMVDVSVGSVQEAAADTVGVDVSVGGTSAESERLAKSGAVSTVDANVKA